MATNAPVVGVATITEAVVPGCATGANQEQDIEAASRFCLEVAKGFTAGTCQFYDPQQFETLTKLYGSMKGLQGLGGRYGP